MAFDYSIISVMNEFQKSLLKFCENQTFQNSIIPELPSDQLTNKVQNMQH